MATADEAALLARLNAHVHDVHVQAEPDVYRPTDPREVEAWFRERLAWPGWRALVAEVDGEAVGLALMELVESPGHAYVRPQRYVCVNQLAVAPEHRRLGIGRRLMEEVHARAEALGVPRVDLDVRGFNAGAMRFYEALGYRVRTMRMSRGVERPSVGVEARDMETIDEIGGRTLVLRDEREQDRAAVGAVSRAAFEGPAEAELVDALRAAGALVLSLVAAVDGEVVGHVAFSPVTITGPAGTTSAIGLAPMAVEPSWQRKGVGTRLIGEGLDRLRAAGHRAVVVLGHPEYYPRHGFSRASRFGLRWEHPARDEAFMALELVPRALAGIEGVVRYHPEFDRFG